MKRRKDYWKGKARAHRYAVLVRDGASKRDAKRYSAGAFSMAVYWELQAFISLFKAQRNSDLWGDETQPRREITGLASIIGEA